MTDVATRRPPELGAVWKEQLRVTRLAFGREAALVLGALALLLLAGVLAARFPALAALLDSSSPGTARFDPAEPGFAFVGVVIALVFCVLVWRGERPFGDSPLWSLPVDHRRHTLMKVAAGWVWLMAILGTAYLLLVLATIASGGVLGADEVRAVITDSSAFFAGDAGATRDVAWTTPWWEWVAPLSAATAAYLAASALWLGVRLPLVWAVGIWMVGGMTMGLAWRFDIQPLVRGFDLLGWFIGAEDFNGFWRLATGDRAFGWTRLPTLGLWLGSSVFWIGLTGAGLFAAVRRPRDH